MHWFLVMFVCIQGATTETPICRKKELNLYKKAACRETADPIASEIVKNAEASGVTITFMQLVCSKNRTA